MVYKSKRKQRKYQRDYKWASRHGTKFKNPWKGMEKIGTEKIVRKGRILPLRARNGRKPETWLKKAPKRKSTFGGI